LRDKTDWPSRGDLDEIQNILLSDYVVTFRSYEPIDGEQHALRIGVEYPSGSKKFTYDNNRFEALEPPPVAEIDNEISMLSQRIQSSPDGNPYFPARGQ